jgi:HPt (histidine-containing phosphotransfer) domain-containing protein
MHADEIAEGARPYDRQAILETLHGDMDALRELAQMFMTDHRLMLDEARRMIDVDNIDGLARVAHTLKGMIGNFAAAEASKAAETFYKLAHKGHKAKAAKALQRLELRLTDLCAALDRDLFHTAEAIRLAS